MASVQGVKRANWEDIWVRIGTIPGLALYILFAIVPLIVAIYFSFMNWNGLSPARWTGIANYVELFHDPLVGVSLIITIKYVVVTWLLQITISLLLGVFLVAYKGLARFYSVIYILPLLLSSVAIALTWQELLDPNLGVINGFFNRIGLHFLALPWLGNAKYAIYVVGVVASWQFVSFYTMLFQAAVGGIPAELFEAGKLDGATPLGLFFHIILPGVKYTIITATVLIAVGGLTGFEYTYSSFAPSGSEFSL